MNGWSDAVEPPSLPLMRSPAYIPLVVFCVFVRWLDLYDYWHPVLLRGPDGAIRRAS